MISGSNYPYVLDGLLSAHFEKLGAFEPGLTQSGSRAKRPQKGWKTTDLDNKFGEFIAK